MLSILKIKVGVPENINLNFNVGSIFHGFLMEKISPDYAEKLHKQGLKPFTQSLTKIPGENIILWKIATLDDEAHDMIILELIKSSFERIYLKHKEIELEVLEKELCDSYSYKNFTAKVFSSDTKRKTKIVFSTPASFKSGEEYQIFPKVEHIYKSIISKWNAFSDNSKVDDEDAFNYLIENTRLVEYNLRTTNFHLEKTKIPSFMGNVVLYTKGPEQMSKLARLLFEFSEYSGIGIKTSIGMGGISIE